MSIFSVLSDDTTDLKLGEIYTSPILGPIVITELFNNLSTSTGCIGTFNLLMGTRNYSLYNSRKLVPTTDEEIEKCIFNYMTTEKLSDKLSIAFDEDGVYIFDDDNHISLNREELSKMLQVLRKEINE